MSGVQKKAEQNRLAQKAFRERKSNIMKALDQKVSDLAHFCKMATTASGQGDGSCVTCTLEKMRADDAVNKCQILEQQVAVLQKQNSLLKSLVPSNIKATPISTQFMMGDIAPSNNYISKHNEMGPKRSQSDSFFQFSQPMPISNRQFVPLIQTVSPDTPIPSQMVNDAERKAEANRLAQRSFRERKNNRMRELEVKVTELAQYCKMATINAQGKACGGCSTEKMRADEATERLQALSDQVAALTRQNTLLKSLIPSSSTESVPTTPILSSNESYVQEANNQIPFTFSPMSPLNPMAKFSAREESVNRSRSHSDSFYDYSQQLQISTGRLGNATLPSLHSAIPTPLSSTSNTPSMQPLDYTSYLSFNYSQQQQQQQQLKQLQQMNDQSQFHQMQQMEEQQQQGNEWISSLQF
ncbi:hypothetical protein HDU98_007684 [Podochytrium sp. JEL0797]|nr:hypothetical protein HDU98_007684 [Podochytrium sp. JEL0797]